MTTEQLNILKKLYEVHNQGYDLTRKALSKVDANIYIAAENAFDGKWLNAKRAFYVYEKEIKKKEREKLRKEASAKKNKSKSKKTTTQKTSPNVIDIAEVVANESVSTEEVVNTPVASEQMLLENDISVEEINTSEEIDNLNNNEVIADMPFSDLELTTFQKIDTLITDEQENSLDVDVIPDDLIDTLKEKDALFYAMAVNILGSEENLINNYAKYYALNNVKISEEGMIDAISEGIHNGDIVVADSFKDKFGSVYDAMINKYGSLEDALTSLLKVN